ncbi:MAG: hypothetical protein H8E40_12640 [Chloroflexi bacterium]|nr:hypothetical protein [Chloroflexota bacterium]
MPYDLLDWVLEAFPEPDETDWDNNNWVELPAEIDPATWEYEYEREILS